MSISSARCRTYCSRCSGSADGRCPSGSGHQAEPARREYLGSTLPSDSRARRSAVRERAPAQGEEVALPRGLLRRRGDGRDRWSSSPHAARCARAGTVSRRLTSRAGLHRFDLIGPRYPRPHQRRCSRLSTCLAGRTGREPGAESRRDPRDASRPHESH